MAAGDRIRNGTGAAGIERMEASFHGRPFAPHRHDTYAIGVTRAGVQSFNFRGQRWHCLPGQCHILHPDETHDGSAGTEEGFSYRMVYMDPALVQEALGGKPLPFVANPVVEATRLAALGVTEVWDIDEDTLWRPSPTCSFMPRAGRRRKPRRLRSIVWRKSATGWQARRSCVIPWTNSNNWPVSTVGH
jgi:hypothetical protein